MERNKSVENDYSIIKQIGRGSIGVICLAESKLPEYYKDGDDTSTRDGESIQSGSRRGGSKSYDGQESRKDGLKRQYAIKEINAHHLVDEKAFDSLKTEVQVLRMLDHPFIIRIFGCYSTINGENEKLSVVMELCTGGSLACNFPYKESTVKILVANVVEAVLYLHNHKVIHRDLKVRGRCIGCFIDNDCALTF